MNLPGIRVTVCVPLIAFIMLLGDSCAQAKPMRIVSTDRGADEYLMLLAERKNILALTSLARNPDVSNILEEAKDIPVNRGSLEEIVLLKPDLVITGRFFNTMKMEMLRKLCIPYYVMDTPVTFDDVREQTRKLGEVLGEQQKAKEVIAAMDARLARLPSVPDNRRSTVVFYWAGGYTSGSDTLVNAIVQAAGGENIGMRFGGAKTGLQGNMRIALEDLILAKPDIIVFSNFRDDAPTVARQIMHHPALRREKLWGRAGFLPAKIVNSTSPMVVQAVEMLHAMLVKP